MTKAILILAVLAGTAMPILAEAAPQRCFSYVVGGVVHTTCY
jgi:hypothetical protein